MLYPQIHKIYLKCKRKIAPKKKFNRVELLAREIEMLQPQPRPPRPIEPAPTPNPNFLKLKDNRQTPKLKKNKLTVIIEKPNEESDRIQEQIKPRFT
jgi:hypothetical protein